MVMSTQPAATGWLKLFYLNVFFACVTFSICVPVRLTPQCCADAVVWYEVGVVVTLRMHVVHEDGREERQRDLCRTCHALLSPPAVS
jgi:hypothetical protein